MISYAMQNQVIATSSIDSELSAGYKWSLYEMQVASTLEMLGSTSMDEHLIIICVSATLWGEERDGM